MAQINSPRSQPWKYSNHGLTQKQDFLDSIMPAALWYPIEEQQKMADMITRTHAQDLSWCRNRIHAWDPEDLPRSADATAVGNLAYLALYGHKGAKVESGVLYQALMHSLRAGVLDVKIPEPQLQEFDINRPFPRQESCVIQ